MVLACVPVGAWTDRTIRMKPTPKPAAYVPHAQDTPMCVHYQSCRRLFDLAGREWRPCPAECTHRQEAKQ